MKQLRLILWSAAALAAVALAGLLYFTAGGPQATAIGGPFRLKDQNGRIVWTCSKGLPGVGWLDDRGKSPGRAAWEKILAENPSELTCTAIDDTMPGGPHEVTRHFLGPFTQCDRIEDYRRAWAHFERLRSEEAA